MAYPTPQQAYERYTPLFLGPTPHLDNTPEIRRTGFVKSSLLNSFDRKIENRNFPYKFKKTVVLVCVCVWKHEVLPGTSCFGDYPCAFTNRMGGTPSTRERQRATYCRYRTSKDSIDSDPMAKVARARTAMCVDGAVLCVLHTTTDADLHFGV
jgi:hypothetical protein